MPIPIRFIEKPALHIMNSESRYYDGTIDFSKLAPGEMCYYHYQGVPCIDRAHLENLHLTAHYFAANSGRPPLALALPNHSGGNLYFLVDGQCYSNKCTRCGEKVYKNTCAIAGKGECIPKGYYDGWTVAGNPPIITVAPSVDYDDPGPPPVKHYHGLIQNGIIGDG